MPQTQLCLNLPQRIERQPVASPFYCHPYGGIARDIYVTREGFIRFFELDEFDIAIAEAFAGQGQKMYDKLPDDWTEVCGYINLLPSGKMTYRIDFISRDPQRISELLAIAPYLWKSNDDCDPHGIERPHDAIIWGDYSGPPELY